MKNLKNLGKVLNKTEQKEILGGRRAPSFNELCAEGTLNVCTTNDDCCQNETCNISYYTNEDHVTLTESVKRCY